MVGAVLDVGYGTAVNELPCSTGMPHGWRSMRERGAFSHPWIDHWCVGPTDYVHRMVRDVERGDMGTRLLHKGVYPLSNNFSCLGWVQMYNERQNQAAFDLALCDLMCYRNWRHSRPPTPPRGSTSESEDRAKRRRY